MAQRKRASRKIIKSRFRMMGEGIIPKEAFEDLSDESVKIFLTESDTNNWPPELFHLKKYVPEDTAA
jgi:hypothetical protein